MTRAKVLTATGGFIVATAISGLSSFAAAAPVPVTETVKPAITESMFCPLADDDDDDTCGLAIDKQVSVNGGTFVNADTSVAAASAKVGDTITYKLTLTGNEGEDELTTPGTVYIADLLPSGVTYVSSTATSGSYNSTSGTPFANMWNVPLEFSQPGETDDVVVTNLPATLTIVTKAAAVGLQKNTATVAKYTTKACSEGCTYSDPDPADDTNDAWVNITAAAVLGASTTTPNTTVTGTAAGASAASTPQVLGATTGTLTNTGINTRLVSLIAGSIMTVALGVIAYNPLVRKLQFKR